jgi:hypothetical protein
MDHDLAHAPVVIQRNGVPCNQMVAIVKVGAIATLT